MRKFILGLVPLFLILLAPLAGVGAQDNPRIQKVEGSLAPGQVDIFKLPGMKQGQVLSAAMQNLSGNLDPFLAILHQTDSLATDLDNYRKAVADLAANSPNPLLDLPALRDQYTLAWDDDSGAGFSAALKFTFPEDGDYILLASSSLSSAGRQTAGDYRLLVGLDLAEPLSAESKPSGAQIAIQDQTSLQSQLVQEYHDSLDANQPSVAIKLNDLDPGDILYVSLEAVSGDLKPVVLLRDFGNKPVRAANLSGENSSTSFQQAFPEGGQNYFLDIRAAAPGGQATSGDFKLVVGVNAPGVLDGTAEPNSESLIKLAIPVKIGFKLQQIINLDQPNEIMKAAGTLKLEWTDPALAFDPASCNCLTRRYTENSYNKFLDDVKGKWPDFTFFNQQGNRWSQNRLIEIESNGHVTYLERFSTDFQIDFDWTKYPFDSQDFNIKVDMLFPQEEYVFAPMEGFNEIDPNHGEDEFILTDFDTQISSETSSRLVPTSRFTFHFNAPRHHDYYIFRIIIPVLLIISVSYITFFLKDYTRRIEIATGNLLLFIAFSFSLGDNYPRMGYLTFLDVIMAITFVINTAVVGLNVYYKWLENNDQREKADRLEAPMNYIYPLAYLVSFGLAALFMLR